MTTRRFALLFVLLAQTAAAAGCVASLGPNNDPDDDDVVTPDGGVPPPPPPPPPPSAEIYKRGSMKPQYQLTPRVEYGRFTENGDTMTDADFISTAGNFVSASQKMDELAAQIAVENELPSLDLIPKAEDRQRAQQIPFRGNPSDVDFIKVNGKTKLYVPLGGDLMTPGNEVAAVTLGANNIVTRVKVGIRPQRVAIHPAGLVFVCNQYSNYISVIDPTTDQPLRFNNQPVEIATDYYCTDLLFVPRNPQAADDDEQDLYVSNGYRSSVLKYGLSISRDPNNNRPINVTVSNPVAPQPENQPAAEITGVGKNPYRLSLSQDQRAIYVANNRGGEVGRIDIASQSTRKLYVNAPTLDVVQINDIVLIPTTTRDRGLLAVDEPQQPIQVLASPAIVTGVDGLEHVAHPGALFDDTKSYNFQDLRNGLLVADSQFSSQQRPAYFTDDTSSEPNFVAEQKVLTGALPQAIVRNAAGTRAFMAMSSSDVVQEIQIVSGAFRIKDDPAAPMQTAHRPFALSLNEDDNQLYVADWGGEVLEVFDVANGNRLEQIDLGYATAPYPATNMELGEFLFYNADWSNTQDFSCATCHVDELLQDGIGFANGATAPTQYHQVTPNWNLATTGAYFWNGSFDNGSYASLAADAQTRTNCELILFGLIEGPASNPNNRVGDPNNRVTNADDANCRPITAGAGVFPDNFDEIQTIIAAQKLIKNQIVLQETGLNFGDVIKVTDWYSVSELRLPPSPVAHLADKGELSSEDAAKIQAGSQIFLTANCNRCHDPGNSHAPYTDELNHGNGSEWVSDFVDTYFQDPRIVDVIGGIPAQMTNAIRASVNDSEINVHLDPIDYFVPFCFDVTSCLFFEDPLAVRGNVAAETERLDLLVTINLGNVERGHVPGNVRGQPTANTPPLRGVWWESNYLRHGLAHSISEAILAPGHPALLKNEQGVQVETGYAINALGETDVHGMTSSLSPEQVEELRLFLQTIQ